ncbi:hypothetical protein EJ08DRAFT_657603 [Tothia fuscella]|uniref:RNA polymerase II assembly factor Rtp1 C-terminal domain-containing protein n=1 Tax=Tothia fuscella TaxID=1048955 RepID=A0A9P4U0S3_9PEZI|nr:hypothetical protein EJ08DRAFT_657603 [Tothia fuscella]
MSEDIPGIKDSVLKAISAANHFLDPALKDRDSNASITEKIASANSSELSASVNDDARRGVIQEACTLLIAVHKAVLADQSSSSKQPAYNSTLLSAVYNLLDILILEGIYPSLPKNVGSPVERRAKCLLYRKPDPAYIPIRDLSVLPYVVREALNPIAANYDVGIEPMLRHKALGDLVAGNLCLMQSSGDVEIRASLDLYFHKIPIDTLYRALTALIKPATPEWFRSSMAGYLSLLPLRKDGVRHTIDFIAYSHPATGAGAKEELPNASQGPSLPIEALQQATQLLSSVPQTMTADDYFSQLAPQLLDLIDGSEGPEISQASGFIISSGILAKRTLGAPGTVGWRLFAEPLLSTFNPPITGPTRKRKASTSETRLERQLVSPEQLAVALKRLSTLIKSYPNPGLTGRLLKPLVLPLWGLVNYSKSPTVQHGLSTAAFTLLEAFFRLSGSTPHLQNLADHLLWDGTADWEYGPSSDGGIAIRERQKQSSVTFNAVTALPDMDRRNSNFLQLLSLADAGTVGAVFIRLSRQWLIPLAEEAPHQLQVESDPMMVLAQAKLAQAILERFQDIISKQPKQILELIEQILTQQAHAAEAEVTRKKGLDKPTYNSLSQIVQKNQRSEPQNFGLDSDSEDMLNVAISLFNSILSSSDIKLEDSTFSVILRIEKLLSQLSQESVQTASVSLKSSSQTALSLILSARSNHGVSGDKLQQGTLSAEQAVQQTLSEIASDLASDLPPLRNSALHTLQALIKTNDLHVDVPAVTLLVLNTIRTDPEEFVYLAAIQTLVELAIRRDLRYTAKSMTDASNDANEQSGVDGRLRIGEALSSLIEAISEYGSKVSSGEKGMVVRGIAEIVISVGGRRGKRKREVQEREQRARLEKRKRREAERMWGGEVPEVPDEDEIQLDPAIRERHRLELEAIDKIVKGWEDTGFEEDIRIRTSALSNLGQLLERCIDDCSRNNIDTAADLALSVLSLEIGPEKAILRRAAILVILSILKAMDNAQEAGKEVAVGLDATKWINIEKVLGWVISTDDDDLVHGHATAVVEGLEAWRMKRLVGQKGEGMLGGVPQMGLEGRLRGLAVSPAKSQGGGVRIQEID